MYNPPMRYADIPWRKIAIALVVLAAIVAVIARFWTNNVVVFAVLLAATFAVFLRKGYRPADGVGFLLGAILGPSMEAILIRAGAWSYGNPSFLGIPIWLPLLWGLTIVALLRITAWVTCGAGRTAS